MYCIFRGGHFVVERRHRTVNIPRHWKGHFLGTISEGKGEAKRPHCGDSLANTVGAPKTPRQSRRVWGEGLEGRTKQGEDTVRHYVEMTYGVA